MSKNLFKKSATVGQIEPDSKGTSLTTTALVPVFDVKIGVGSLVCFRSAVTSKLGELDYGIINSISEYEIVIISKDGEKVVMTPPSSIDFELFLLYDTTKDVTTIDEENME